MQSGLPEDEVAGGVLKSRVQQTCICKNTKLGLLSPFTRFDFQNALWACHIKQWIKQKKIKSEICKSDFLYVGACCILFKYQQLKQLADTINDDLSPFFLDLVL